MLIMGERKCTIMNIFDLSKQVAIIVGGDQGIGFGIARGLAGAGASVVIADFKSREEQKGAETLKKEGFNAVAIPTDITNKSSVEALVSEVMKNFGKIDILVNSAGAIVRKPAEDTLEEDWDYVMNTNLKGVWFCCMSAGREMIKRKKGKIINISSMLSEVSMPRRSVYCVSKAAVSHLTQSLGLEWIKYNINVNAIAPGPTETTFIHKYFQEHPEDIKAFIDPIPRGRPGNPSDYAGVAVFLASDASDFVVGQTFFVDGGYNIQ
ncbi:SDR family NAD(P)-dependent oxidoreductase [Chloroflexota bacterium]